MQSTRRKLIYNTISRCNTIYEPTKLYYYTYQRIYCDLLFVICILLFSFNTTTNSRILQHHRNNRISFKHQYVHILYSRIILHHHHECLDTPVRIGDSAPNFISHGISKHHQFGHRSNARGREFKTIVGLDTPVHIGDSAPNFLPIGSPTHHPSEHKWLAGSD